MEVKIRSEYVMLSMLSVVMVLFAVSILHFQGDTVLASSETKTSLSNQKIGWGIKREKDHKQPDLGSKNKAYIDEANGIAMGNPESKKIYLTFDEGYEAGYTDKILEILQKNQVKAAFFITAHYLNSQPELVKKMIDGGHIVGNHTVNHYSMPSLDDDKLRKEVMDLHQTVYEKFHYDMKYLRPPKGEYSQRTLALTNSLGYRTVMWSLAYDDWNEKQPKGVEYAKSRVLDNLHAGAVILLHGNSVDNCNALEAIIQGAKEQGYEFKSLDEFER